MLEKPNCKTLEKRVLELEKTESELKKTEELLRHEIFWMRMLIEESRDGIVVLDQSGKVYEANRQYADMLGYSMEEVRQLHVWDWDALFSKEKILQMIMMVDGAGDHFETRHRRKDGTLIDVEISTNGGVYKGRKLVFCVCRDITERIQAAEEREALIRKLQKAMAEIKILKGIILLCSFCKKFEMTKTAGSKRMSISPNIPKQILVTAYVPNA